VRHPLIVNLISFLLIHPLSTISALSRNIDNQLETGLNKNKHELLKDLFLEKAFKQFNKQYIYFTRKYKDTKWSIKTRSKHQNKRVLDLDITSTRKIGDQKYILNSKQTIKIETYKNKIKDYQVLKEESILNSQNSPLIVTVSSPDKVLTGERYEINLIIEKPLNYSFIASGLITLENKDPIPLSENFFGIKPNLSGGLFKYIQAPLQPGFQTISAIIVHPEGIYSMTKRIKVDLQTKTILIN
tara:strand:+ start:88 stop:816 length:729 start_codon:yes stop_codon:yes gene_type:complete